MLAVWCCLNEVRPRRPEQFRGLPHPHALHRNSLNEVRPRRPEQSLQKYRHFVRNATVSMKSGLEGRNNIPAGGVESLAEDVSMKSGLEGRNNATPTPARRHHAPRSQ